jgi:hypothetical protein
VLLIILLEASRPRLVCLLVELQSQDFLSMWGVDISPQHRETNIHGKIGYEPTLSSKQYLLSMRGVEISPQHKEKQTN